MTHAAPNATPSFVWRLIASEGVELTGEKKAELADKMTEIVQRACVADECSVDVRIGYDVNEVIASVFPLPTDAMRRRAADKARLVAQTGVSGMISATLLFFFRLGKAGGEELVRRLTLDYLNDELAASGKALERRLSELVSNASIHTHDSRSQIERPAPQR